MQMVLGKIVRLRTREFYKCIDSRLSWGSPVYISEKAEQEVKFWSDLVKVLSLKGRDFTESVDFETVLFCDASSVGYGGYLEYTENQTTDNLQTFEGLSQVYGHDFSLTKAAISNLDKVSLVAPKMAILNTSEVVKSVALVVVKSVTHGIVDTYGRKNSTHDFMKTINPGSGKFSYPRSGKVSYPKSGKLSYPEVVRSVDPEMVRSVTSEVVRSVTANVVMSVALEVVLEAMRSATPEVVMSVTPKVVRSDTHKLVSSVTP